MSKSKSRLLVSFFLTSRLVRQCHELYICFDPSLTVRVHTDFDSNGFNYTLVPEHWRTMCDVARLAQCSIY